MITQIILPENDLLIDNDNGWAIKNSQFITDAFLDRIKERRYDSTAFNGEGNEVADIPCAVIDKWMREGFNALDPAVSASEIVARLRRENLDAFITTDKRV